MRWSARAVLSPPTQTVVGPVTDHRERRGILVELAIVGALTFAFSAVVAILALLEMQLTAGVGASNVALNPSTSTVEFIDAARQILRVVRLVAIAALGAYLLWRSGLVLSRLGLGRPVRADVPPGLVLAALIGLPGLALVAAASALGINAQIQASQTDAAWWQWGTWVLIAAGNGLSEEIVVVAYFLTRLRQLGVSENRALLASATLRAGYHLYQGVGAGVGNFVMGLIFGRYYQLTSRVWPLVIAHTTINTVAYIGYALVGDRLPWV